MKRALILMLTLSACAHKPQLVYCLTPEQLQELEKAEPEKVAPKLTGRADEDIRIISGSALRLRAWGRGNLEVLRGCTG
jgi:hypothetical protein